LPCADWRSTKSATSPKYGKQLKALADGPSIAILNQVIDDERKHYQTLGNLIRSRRPLPASPPEHAQEALDSLLNARKDGHPEAAAWVGDAIYGVNDGLGSIFGIVSGVSGATLGNSHFVLMAGLAGLAGMVASALSMGSGAYLAAKSEREIYEAEFAREREAVESNEGEAREVLSLSYQIRGLPEEDAERFVEHLARNKEQLIKALARERLNTSEEALSKPLVSAISGALHCGRSVNPDYSILLHGRNSGGDCCGSRLTDCALRCGSCKVAHYNSFMVEQWT
jgi:vacuolar iron transporter family protein